MISKKVAKSRKYTVVPVSYTHLDVYKRQLRENPTIKILAKKHECSWAQIALAWAIQRDTAAIPKSVNKKRLQENLDAAKIKLDEHDMAKMSMLDQHFRFINGETGAQKGTDYTLSLIHI